MEFIKSEKSARILRSSGFWHFFQIWKIPLVSTSKVNEKGRHFWRLGTHTAPHSFRRKKIATLHMTCKGTYKWNLQIRKKFQNPGNLRILELFSDLQNSTCKYPSRLCEVPPILPPRRSHRYPHSYGPKKKKHFACHFRVLRNGILQIRKKCRILRSSGLRHSFWICKIPLLSTLTGHVKCRSYFSMQV